MILRIYGEEPMITETDSLSVGVKRVKVKGAAVVITIIYQKYVLWLTDTGFKFEICACSKAI